MRILITGSRDWTDRSLVRKELDSALKIYGPFTLIHGACPTGVDYFAHVWGSAKLAQGKLEDVEGWPAEWSRGRRAGPERNTAMVRSGVDLCLAFIKNDSKGATQCLSEAIQAGTPYRLWELRYEELPKTPTDGIEIQGIVTFL